MSLEKEFYEAAEWLKSQTGLRLSQEELLRVYALYKQSTTGPCPDSFQKPSLFDFSGRAKFSAWKDLGSLSKDESMTEYIRIVSDLQTRGDPLTSSASTGEPTLSFKVSTMSSHREELLDGQKSLFQWAEEGNLERVLGGLLSTTIDQQDEMGMTLLHWAADRNHLDMARELLSVHQANPNLRNADEETPLYLACMAEHKDMAQLLIKNGADTNLINWAEEPELRDWLASIGFTR